jgi:hypothetical protein
MKKVLLSVALITASFMSNAQVGINTTTPEGALDVVSENSGIILPRVANVSAVTSPVNGMMVYDLLNKCFRGYENGAWSNCLNGAGESTPNGPPITSGLCQGQPEEFTFNGLTYRPVGSSVKCWLDRNLGASQVATASDDFNAYGDLYQWGRNTDGHEIIYWTSSTASDGMEQNNEIITQSSSPSPGAAFITGSPNWYTGTDPNPDNLWQGESGTNNPCPTGFRLPTDTELEAERNNGGTGFWGTGSEQNNAAGAFA